jgi:hypothetical protein
MGQEGLREIDDEGNVNNEKKFKNKRCESPSKK